MRFCTSHTIQPRSSSNIAHSIGNCVNWSFGNSVIVAVIHVADRLAALEAPVQVLQVDGVLGELVGPRAPVAGLAGDAPRSWYASNSRSISARLNVVMGRDPYPSTVVRGRGSAGDERRRRRRPRRR